MTALEAKKNKYYLAWVDKEINIPDLFAQRSLLPFEDNSQRQFLDVTQS